ncbi:DUF6090 family protein [Roseivirga misakiensis]|uniref:Uncharacterized protein n=1 Tax=Roseivirga misakiensis TaxID=1563681 RepID=A0A1E5SYK7_9BACT|nr:DUF6090 family protein [Roseivirga misakiensis]OEK04214.1 hypothetical protein BFP71_12075 [Roseivirga misakiensis]
MLYFLRKLRRKDMRNSKYVKYAIGEIFLVVTGILIALAINNWNQRRLSRIEEKKLLENISVDFKEAVRTLGSLNKRRDESILNFQMLIEALSMGNTSDTKHLDSLLGKSIFTPTYNGKNSSLSIIINSGKINLLKNESLKSMLLKWPQQVEDMTEGELDAKKLTYNTWVPLISSYTSTNDWFVNGEFSNVLPFRKRKTSVKKNYKGLFEDDQFENIISLLELLYISGKLETEGLINQAEKIIGAIANEYPNLNTTDPSTS